MKIQFTLLIVTLIFLLSPLEIFSAGNDVFSFQKIVRDIMVVNRVISRVHERSVLGVLEEKRRRLVDEGYRLFAHIEGRSLPISLDVSSRYALALQKYPLSCEIAALRIIYNSLSSQNITEDAIIDDLPHFPGSFSGGIWGDPEKEFVGSYEGVQGGKTGYGIYAYPLQVFLEKRDMSSEEYSRISFPDETPSNRLTRLLSLVSRGSHVILWGDWCTIPFREDGLLEKVDQYIVSHFPVSGKNFCSRSAQERKFFWKTPDGKDIAGIAGEHTFLLLGYIGALERPSHIIVWDTNTGKHIYRTAEWMRKWELLDYRSLIIHGDIK